MSADADRARRVESITRAYIAVAGAARRLVAYPADREAKRDLRVYVECLDELLVAEAESRVAVVLAEVEEIAAVLEEQA